MKQCRDISLCILLVLFGALGAPLSVLAAASADQNTDILLVIGPDAAGIAGRAGGMLVGPERAPLAAFVTGGPDIVSKLEAAGAWWVTDGTRLAALCL